MRRFSYFFFAAARPALFLALILRADLRCFFLTFLSFLFMASVLDLSIVRNHNTRIPVGNQFSVSLGSLSPGGRGGPDEGEKASGPRLDPHQMRVPRAEVVVDHVRLVELAV